MCVCGGGGGEGGREGGREVVRGRERGRREKERADFAYSVGGTSTISRASPS